ncbi:helix-turn-helix transcriptional regulator [Variovorax sp. PAMC26660]|uniref:helix-turn-helix transcriptional regulator n=1 Tax=Variovorax sp. PAMC26660 TaxID=2762322 RepID=UPI00164D214C|nr:helix-turn-helix transcriptional regulator [Variovorax sp. PAMC26660]QNK68252.1 helix-turn-helix transcriptional regulator [Variovorax sp. PAMC26660]
MTNELTLPVQDAWLGDAVQHLGSSSFHSRLLEGLNTALGVDHVSYLCYDGHGRVQAASAASVLDQNLIESTTEIFVKRFYERDPNYPLMRSDAHDGASDGRPELQLLWMSPASIGDPEYRRLLFDRPGFSSKVSLLRRWRDQTCYLNLYFSRTKVQRDRTARLMRSHASTLMALAHRHDELVSLHRQPEACLWPELSQRERETARLLVEGCTAKEIARQLSLSPATVITYKERVYAKLGVQNLREFLTLARH